MARGTLRSEVAARIGISLVELLVVMAIIGMLLIILFPAIQATREVARRTQCTNRLRQLGTALQSHESAQQSFPPGARVARDKYGTFQFYENANVRLLPYLELASMLKSYDFEMPWESQSSEITSIPISLFVCPANRQASSVVRPILLRFGHNQIYGVTTYLYCKGVTDAWCLRLQSPGTLVAGHVPIHERGMFDLNFAASIRDIKDGLGKTIAMGEGAGGPSWPLCRGTGCGKAFVDARGSRLDAAIGWIVGEPNSDVHYNRGFIAASIYGCTMEHMNKKPVTDTMVSSLYWNDCRSSTNGGSHSTSNFRSDHPGGGNFLAADGSVYFLSETIDLRIYQELSTIKGGESHGFP